MSIKYTWDILSLTKTDYPTLNLTDVVVSVTWKKTATNEKGVSVSYTCETPVPPPTDPSSFSDLDDLTEEQVIEWVVTNVGEDAAAAMAIIDATLAKELESPVKPEGVVVPWNKPKTKKASKKKSK